MSFLPGLFQRASTTTPTPATLDRLDYPVGPGGFHPPPRLLRRGDHGPSKGKGGMSKSALSAMTVMSFMFFLQMLEMSMEKIEMKMMSSTMAPAHVGAPSTIMIMSRRQRDVADPEDAAQEVDSTEVLAEPPGDDGDPSGESRNYADQTNDEDETSINEIEKKSSNDVEDRLSNKLDEKSPNEEEDRLSNKLDEKSPSEEEDRLSNKLDEKSPNEEDSENEDVPQENEDFELQVESSPVEDESDSDLQHSAADIFYCSGLLVCETRRLVGHGAANLLSGALVWLSGDDEKYAKKLTEATESARQSDGCKKHIQDCQHDGESTWLPLMASVLENIT